jgi:spermidine synthase
MSRAFEELAHEFTPMGELTLRRRLEPTLQVDVYEVKLGDEFLMSSLFTIGEREVARLALAEVSGEQLDIVVGGLGLGYTAAEALTDPRVRSMRVVEALGEVIDWHRRGLVPIGSTLADDDRCELVHASFFANVAEGAPFGTSEAPSQQFDAILVDIDHSPTFLLDPGHASFYEPDGLRRLQRYLRPRGVFTLWSDEPPDAEFMAVLRAEFATARAAIVSFPNFYTGEDAESTVYVATTEPTEQSHRSDEPH